LAHDHAYDRELNDGTPPRGRALGCPEPAGGFPSGSHDIRTQHHGVAPMEPSGRRSTIVDMTLPIVTELPLVLEPVTADTFAGGTRIVAPAPIPTRPIVD
jgi:hypothetical protein